ncbi:hypothetical protein GCM10010234_16980 [Streptomyces hawaiiensis]
MSPTSRAVIRFEHGRQRDISAVMQTTKADFGRCDTAHAVEPVSGRAPGGEPPSRYGTGSGLRRKWRGGRGCSEPPGARPSRTACVRRGGGGMFPVERAAPERVVPAPQR